LALVRRLVEMHGGRVLAQSEGPGLGSEFTVALPAASPARVAEGEVRDGARFSPVVPLDLRVLVVDDNQDVAESTAVLLRMSGCDVHVVYDGDEALRAMPRLRPDAVLLDIGLPKVNGYQVAERIRAEPEHRRTLIVAISGYGQEEHRLQSQQSGFDYHIVKPIDPPVLTGLLASLWSHRGPSAPENVVSFPQRKTAE